MPDEPATTLHEQQLRLSRHLRDPERQPAPPGIEERRLRVYRELFFDNIQGLLAGNFPVLRKTIGTEAWRSLVRGFYAQHHCQTPLFAEIGREFVQFLEQGREHAPGLAEWAPELAHYEWVELALQVADVSMPVHDPDGDLLAGIPQVSPLAWPLAYRWPVANIGPGSIPASPPAAPTLLLVHRDATHRVRFSELSPLVFRLLQLVQPAAVSGGEALDALAIEAEANDLAGFRHEGGVMLERLRAEGSIIGTVPRA